MSEYLKDRNNQILFPGGYIMNNKINILINDYKYNKNEDSFKKILNKYNNLIYSIIYKYKKDILNTKEDIYQICMISLIKALNTFDVEKNVKFGSYLTRIIKNDLNELYVYTNRQKRKVITTSIDNIIPGDERKQTIKDALIDTTVNIEENIIDNDIIFIYDTLSQFSNISNKHKKKAEIIERILKDNKTFRELAAIYGYKSKSSIDAIYKEFIEYAKKIYKNSINN